MNRKIKKELKEFKEFKKKYKFCPKEFTYVGEDLYCDGELLQKEGESPIGETEKWINVGYKLKSPFSKSLSNLFPYEFDFDGMHLNSIESFFQGIKIRNKHTQKIAFKYSGIDSNSLKAASDFNWKETQTVYWKGEAIARDSAKYDGLIDKLYISAIQNPLYRNVLKNVTKPIIHSIGTEDKKETVYTRFELEYMLNCLVCFLKADT